MSSVVQTVTSVLFSSLGACGNLQKAEAANDEDASELQLNAFEFRNYRTSLDPSQQRLLERVVNQWCSLLVRGKTLKVNNLEEKVYMDRDLLTLDYHNEFYPLKTISRMEMFKDTDDMMGAPWVLEVTFEGLMGDRNLIFNFEQERQRLNFALTLRILRTRDPSLDPSQTMEVAFLEDEDDEDQEGPRTFGRIVATQHYNISKSGIPVVFSVSELKLFQKLQSSSRHVYLEFFVKYPSLDRFLYAKSPTTHIPPHVMLQEDHALRRKKDNKGEDEDEDKKKEDAVKQQVEIGAMRFELKNVKLKIPKVPHTVFGRLMAKDDYFPTAVGTFQFKVEKSYLQDRRSISPEEKVKEKGRSGEEGARKVPETLKFPMHSAWKAPEKKAAGQAEDWRSIIGELTIRIMGYVTDEAANAHLRNAAEVKDGATAGDKGKKNYAQEKRSSGLSSGSQATSEDNYGEDEEEDYFEEGEEEEDFEGDESEETDGD